LGGAAGGDATNCCGGCPHGDGGVTNGDGGDRPEKNACETAGEWARVVVLGKLSFGCR